MAGLRRSASWHLTLALSAAVAAGGCNAALAPSTAPYPQPPGPATALDGPMEWPIRFPVSGLTPSQLAAIIVAIRP